MDKLRKELPNIPDMEWMKPDDKATSIPVKIEVHNTQENLLALHDKFSLLHRKYEQIVNAYKAKIKNLVGYRIGTLTVLERKEKKGKFYTWLCKCDCGKEKIISGKHLLTCKSCGCTRSKNLLGKNFGELTILERKEKKVT